ncbi:coiled-coil domain-containing protein 15 [Carlito syrichta]|uniref:Coiled-coil domain-containing protein 15 n=1 Tax=Carlito syrichta TaxID=1868482 RepID=A0A3Q0DUF3_CARSF|nr:coiled-coil domain-containing protein 15 [Carlito syrichta]
MPGSMAPLKKPRNTTKSPLALNPLKSKDVLAVLAERNPAIVPVGAWVEPASPDSSEIPAYTSAYMIEEELKEQLRKKQEALKHFQKQVKHRVNQQIRLRKQEALKQLQKSYEVAEKEDFRVMQSLPAHLTSKRTNIFSNNSNAAIGSSRLPPSQILGDGREDEENQNELFQQQTQALSQTVKQACHQLASFKIARKKKGSEFPDDGRKSFSTQEKALSRKPASTGINIGTRGKLPFKVHQGLLTTVHYQNFMENQEPDYEEFSSIMTSEKEREDLFGGDQQDIFSEDEDKPVSKVQKVKFKNPLFVVMEEEKQEQLHLEELQDILPEAQDYPPEAQENLLEIQCDLAGIQNVELEAQSIEADTQAVELKAQAIELECQVVKPEGQAIETEGQAVKTETQGIMLKAQNIELEDESIVLEAQDFLPQNQTFLTNDLDVPPEDNCILPNDQSIPLKYEDQDFLPRDQLVLPKDQNILLICQDQNCLPGNQSVLPKDQNILFKCQDQDFLPKDQNFLPRDQCVPTKDQNILPKCQNQDFLRRYQGVLLKDQNILPICQDQDFLPQDQNFLPSNLCVLPIDQNILPKCWDQDFLPKDQKVHFKEPYSDVTDEKERENFSLVDDQYLPPKPQDKDFIRDQQPLSFMREGRVKEEFPLGYHEYVTPKIQDQTTSREYNKCIKQPSSFEKWEIARVASGLPLVYDKYQSRLSTEFQAPLAFQSGVYQEEEKKERQRQYLRYRRLFMDIEREQVKEKQRQKEQKKKIEKIKKKREQQRYAEEQRILRMNFKEEPYSGERMSEILAQLQLEEIKGVREKQQQREKEYLRYVEALRAQIQKKMQLYNITLPPLCYCGPDFWDAHPDTCASNCIFYKNHRAYTWALHSVISSCDISEGNSALRIAVHNFASAHRRMLKNLY